MPVADALLAVLQSRFERHPARHVGLNWQAVHERLMGMPKALRCLQALEDSGGEPDVIGTDVEALVYCDCSAETPAGRRSACYDASALEARKENRPERSAVEWAASLGIEMLSEAQYRHLQTLGEFDLKTSSWVLTPPAIRSLGGALFCDRRYGTVFT